MESTTVIGWAEAATSADDGPAAASSTQVSADDAVNTITGFLNAQHAELVDVVIELLATPTEWQGEGVWTMPRWLAWRCGVSPATAQQVVDIATRAADLPISMQAFRNGELSLDQMAAVARRAPWWTDEQICTLARMMTVTQLQRTLRDYPFPNLDADGREIRDDVAADPEPDATTGASTDPATDPAADASASGDVPGGVTGGSDSVEEWCSFTFGDDGVFRLNMQADFDTGHIVQAALTEARDRLFHDGQSDVGWVDALRDVSERSLDGVTDSTRRSRFRINLYLDTDDTRRDPSLSVASLSDAAGFSVPDAIRRHLTCDGLLSPVFVASGIPVSVGRTQRIVPDRTRLVVERRDAHRCRVPGCTATAWLEVHHIVHWEHHGETETWNLLLVCPRHHRDHHRGRLGIVGNADLPEGSAGAVEFSDRHGRRIQPSGASPTPPSGPPPTPASVYEHPLGERLQADCLYFRPPPAHRAELRARIARDREIFSTHPDLH